MYLLEKGSYFTSTCILLYSLVLYLSVDFLLQGNLCKICARTGKNDVVLLNIQIQWWAGGGGGGG